MQKYQCPPDAIKTDFETGVARLEFPGANSFNLAYLRHNDKWFTLFEGVSLKECLEAIEEDPWFHVF